MFPNISEIKRKRQMLGLKQKQLAKLSGVSQSLIAKLESGQIDPAYSKVKQIFCALESAKSKEEIKVKELMEKNILFAQPSDNLKELAKKMKIRNISQTPVFKGDSNLGSVSDDTIVRAMNDYGPKYETLVVNNVMDLAFPIIDESTSVENIKPILKFSDAVLITNKGKIVGIVARSDLF